MSPKKTPENSPRIQSLNKLSGKKRHWWQFNRGEQRAAIELAVALLYGGDPSSADAEYEEAENKNRKN